MEQPATAKRITALLLLLLAIGVLSYVFIANRADEEPSPVTPPTVFPPPPSGTPPPAQTLPPLPPKELALVLSSPKEIRLAWENNPSSEIGYVLERREANGSFGTIANLSRETTEYRDLSVKSGATYIYRLYAYNAAGKSPFSNELLALTPSDPLPPPIDPPLDTAPPALSLQTTAEDSSVVATFSASDAENNPASLLLVAGFNKPTLDALALTGPEESFDALPIGAIALPVSEKTAYALAAYRVVVGSGSLAIYGLPNGTPVYFRLRACDSAPEKNCAASPTVAATPTLYKISAAFGEQEIVFDWTSDRCEDLDLPDANAKAIRTANGTLLLFATNDRNYRSFGTSFSDLARDCSAQILTSTDNTSPASFDSREWIWSPYRIGDTIHALIHHEYHDPFASTCKLGDTSSANPCWYSALTYAKSTDNGKTFFQNTANASHLVAAPPRAWESYLAETPKPNVIGYMNPSNIVRHTDGYYYALFDADTSGTANLFPGLCLMRTNTLENPASWRAWNGVDFSLAMPSPYTYPSGNPTQVTALPCAGISPPTLGGMGAASLTYNTYLSRYMLISYARRPVDGAMACGFFASLSKDLLHWTEPQLLISALTPGSTCKAKLAPSELIHYPSIIDHSEIDPNFEKADASAYFYYTVYNGGPGGFDRDLARRTITFAKK